jgi:protein kinase C substrate 80K-H
LLDLPLYRPLESDPSQWRCLDESATIPFTAVNDDYCDCPDGSDEPGTSACSGSVVGAAGGQRNANFYCANEGHIPTRLLASRVNDGICDPECCDGTDEYDGKIQCPNRCAQVGKAYRKQKQQEDNIKRAGSKIRAGYIYEAKKQIETLQAEITALEVEVEVAKENEARKQEELTRAESVGEAVMEEKKKSPLYATLKSHQDGISALLERENELRKELRKLTDLLDDLSSGYNPNYQDMAVKGAVMAYRSWRKGGDIDAQADEEEDEPAETTNEGDEDEGGEGGRSPVAFEENIKLQKLMEEGDWPRSKLRDMAAKETLELMEDDMSKGAVADQEGLRGC